MGFENRNGKQYYYRKERIGNRVISKYVGTGCFADLLAQSDRLCAVKKAHNFIKSLQAKNDLEELDNELDELEANLKILVESFLVGKGFYKTKSREWRLKHEVSEESEKRD